MARLTNEGISGLIGTVVFYSMDGKNYVRSRPRTSKRKKNDPRNKLNEIFGLVSTHGSAMTRQMKGHFLFPFNRAVYNKVRGWMRNVYAEHMDEPAWELETRSSGMCQLNTGIDIRDYFRVDPTVSDAGSGNITLSFPGFIPKKLIKAPSRTLKVNIKLVAVTSAFKNVPAPYNLCTNQFSFIYNNDPVPARSFELQTGAGTGEIAVVALGIGYETAESERTTLRDPRWLPAAIITMGRLK